MEAQNDAMPPDQRLYLPYGISFHHLDERRMHWLRAHDRLIRRVCFQALFTPADPERIRENVMHITLEPRWDDRNPERFFRIKDIQVLPFYMDKNRDPIPNKGFSGFKKERDAREGRSLVRKVALKVDCPPMIQLSDTLSCSRWIVTVSFGRKFLSLRWQDFATILQRSQMPVVSELKKAAVGAIRIGDSTQAAP